MMCCTDRVERKIESAISRELFWQRSGATVAKTVFWKSREFWPQNGLWRECGARAGLLLLGFGFSCKTS